MSADDGLAAFYRARLDEEEADIDTREYDSGQCDYLRGIHLEPGCALAGIKADRKLLAAYAAVAQYDTDDPEPEFASGRAVGLGEAVRIRAARFSGHPDYQAGWKP